MVGNVHKRGAWRGLGAAIGTVTILVLSACVGYPAPIDVDFGPGANSSRVVEWIKGEGAEELEWRTCDVQGPLEESEADKPRAATECSEMTVPVDWFGEGEGVTKVALLRVGATGEAKGDLVLNPGGPGESGVDLAAGMALDSSAQPLLQSFNFIGFDPRGVGSAFGSGDPLICGTEAASDCEPSTKLERYASTASVAHDVEYLRVLLGDAPLNYLGYSYGTYLGAIYARLFPESVGAMVLDGPATDESFSESGIDDQIEAFEQARANFLQACLNGEIGECPFEGTVQDAEDEIAEWSEKYEENPLELEDGLTVDGDSLNGYFETFAYDSRATWPSVAQTLVQVMNDDKEGLMTIADSGVAIDDPISLSVLCAIDDVQDEPGCEPLPVYDPEVSYSGGATIVVIAITGDPATPYVDAVPFVEDLGNAVLVTVDGQGHAASYGKSSCASQIATDYFVMGTVPPADTRCDSDS